MSTALEKAHEARRAAKEAGQPIVRLDPIEKAKRKPTSLRLAISAKCADCVGWHGDPNPRGRIRDCPSTKCPLHPVRPYQKKGGAEDEEGDEDEVPTVKNIVREGVFLYALMSDDKILRSPAFDAESEADSLLEELQMEQPGQLLLQARGWSEVEEE